MIVLVASLALQIEATRMADITFQETEVEAASNFSSDFSGAFHKEVPSSTASSQRRRNFPLRSFRDSSTVRSVHT